MEETKVGVVTKTAEDKDPTLIISKLNIISADRTRKDIQDYLNALMSAERSWFPQPAQLMNLYENITLDGFLTGIVNKRIDAVINKNIYYQDKDGMRVDAFDDLIESEMFRELQKKIMETPFWGRGGVEFEPGEKFCWIEIPRRHIKPEYGLITIDQYSNEGYEYEALDNIWVFGKKRDLGLYLKCAPAAIYKRGDIADWAQYVEIFGQPVRIIYYDAYDQKTKEEVDTVLRESGSSLAMMIPKQAQFEMKDGKQSNGDGQLQEKLKDTCNDEMAIVVLGNTETTKTSSRGGYAQAKVHGQQQLEITKSDIKYMKSYLNSDKFLKVLKSYGYPVVEGGKFVFEKELDLDALKTKIEIDQIVSQKEPVEADYWYNTYGIPKPEKYDELKGKMEADKAAAQKALTGGNNPEDPTEEDPNNPEPTDPPKPDKKPAKEKLIALGFWDQLRTALADFFDPAP